MVRRLYAEKKSGFDVEAQRGKDFIDMKAGIRHMVVFNLIHPEGSAQEKEFLEDSVKILGDIPYATDFMLCREVSPKNGFDYGFSFDFMSEEDYAKYNNDPRHIKYVNERWLKEVTDFMEIDLKWSQ